MFWDGKIWDGRKYLIMGLFKIDMSSLFNWTEFSNNLALIPCIIRQHIYFTQKYCIFFVASRNKIFHLDTVSTHKLKVVICR